jgi:hypothetical protein
MSSYYGADFHAQSGGGGTDSGGFYSGSGYDTNAYSQPTSSTGGGYSTQSMYGADPGAHSSWQSSIQSSYSAQQQQQQQQQTQPASHGAAPAMPFWNPVAAMAATGTLSNDAMLDFAGSAGTAFIQSGWARMIPGFEASMQTLRGYFAVDNRYVVRKMQKVVFPFLSKHWKRSVSSAIH